jgi:NarL family two-component system response regulator LiaR
VPGFDMRRDPDETIRIVIGDDDPLARRTLTEALQHGEFAVVAEATTGNEVIDLARFYHPDVVILGDRVSGVDAVEVMRAISSAATHAAIILLAAEPNDAAGLRALRAGASGYISKDMDPSTLPQIVRGVVDGEAAISRRLSMALVDSYRRAPRIGAGVRPVRSTLTDREWEVLDLLASGNTTDEIARTLVLSTETVRSHLKNLYRKLGVRSRTEATEAAERLRELIG